MAATAREIPKSGALQALALRAGTGRVAVLPSDVHARPDRSRHAHRRPGWRVAASAGWRGAQTLSKAASPSMDLAMTPSGAATVAWVELVPNPAGGGEYVV